jgi:hypothetical protein
MPFLCPITGNRCYCQSVYFNLLKLPLDSIKPFRSYYCYYIFHWHHYTIAYCILYKYFSGHILKFIGVEVVKNVAQKVKQFKKMKISDRINRIDRIRSNPVYPVNPVKRFD